MSDPPSGQNDGGQGADFPKHFIICVSKTFHEEFKRGTLSWRVGHDYQDKWWTTPRLWTSPTSQVTTDKKVDGRPNIAKGKTDASFNL